MRNHKFRAYDKKQNAMLYFTFDSLYAQEGIHHCGECLHGVAVKDVRSVAQDTLLNFNNRQGFFGMNKDLVIMESTEVLDTAKTEIYEEDIVAGGKYGTGPVRYRKDIGRFVIELPDGSSDLLSEYQNLTVIGNTLQNP